MKKPPRTKPSPPANKRIVMFFVDQASFVALNETVRFIRRRMIVSKIEAMAFVLSAGVNVFRHIERLTEKDSPKSNRVIAPLFADCDPPIYADEIGDVQIFRRKKSDPRPKRINVNLGTRMIDIDPSATCEEDLTIAFPRWDLYIHALDAQGRIIRRSCRTIKRGSQKNGLPK